MGWTPSIFRFISLFISLWLLLKPFTFILEGGDKYYFLLLEVPPFPERMKSRGEIVVFFLMNLASVVYQRFALDTSHHTEALICNSNLNRI